jgi:hypothetical protein
MLNNILSSKYGVIFENQYCIKMKNVILTNKIILWFAFFHISSLP